SSGSPTSGRTAATPPSECRWTWTGTAMSPSSPACCTTRSCVRPARRPPRRSSTRSRSGPLWTVSGASRRTTASRTRSSVGESEGSRVDGNLVGITRTGVELVSEGQYDGEGITEGPVWHPEGYLTFVRHHLSLLFKWTPETGKTEVIRENTGYGNGCTLD